MGYGSVTRFEEIKRITKHAVVKVSSSSKSMVAKWFSKAVPLEIAVYGMFASLEIPTLPVSGATDMIPVLEDLEQSKSWRLASQADLDNLETGKALAKWYKVLHKKGEWLVGSGLNVHPSLVPLPFTMTIANLENAGSRFGLEDNKMEGQHRHD